MEYKIGELVESVSKKHTFPSEHIIFLNTSDIEDGNVLNHDYTDVESLPGQAKKSIQKDDILYSEIRPKNKRYTYIDFNAEEYVVSTKLMVIRVIDTSILLPKYIYYYLTSEKIVNHLQNMAESRSGTFPQITFKEVSTLPITLPSIKVQKIIVKFLDSIDDLININDGTIANLEELSHTLFKRWFIDFEFPDQEGLPYKTNGGAIVSDPHFKILPEGWNILSLDEIATFTNGLAMQKYRSEHDDYLPVVKIRELRNGFTDESSDKCIYDIPEKAKLFNGDIVFSWSATLMIKVWSGGRAGLNQHLFKVTSDKFPKWFYYFWTKYYIEFFTRIAKDKATTMGHINRKHLSQAKVSAPNNDIIQVAGKIFEPLFKEIENLNIQNNTLENLRDSLLPKLVSGELELPEELEV